MLNNIPEQQNSKLQIERLAAQRFVYSIAKRVQVLQLILAIPFTIVLSILGLFFPLIIPWQAIYGVSIVLLESILETYQKKLREQAAKIQESFDCDVLDLQWNGLEVGAKPDAELIIENYRSFLQSGGNIEKLVNWYPSIVGNLPIHLARLICQRTNLRWDYQLRKWFGKRALILSVAVIALLFVISLWNKLSLETFILSALTPALPVFSWGFREYQKQNEVAEEQERLKSQVEEYWTDLLKSRISVHQAEIKSRALQNEIYDLRRDSPLIFDTVYEFFRIHYEFLAVKGAEELVREASESIQ